MENKVIISEDNKYELYNIAKRTLDIIIASLGLIILSPVLLITAILIKLESKGPIVFSQIRVGKNGKEFKMYKLRSMVINAEEIKHKLEKQNEMSGPMFKMKNDPRITRVGKFLRKCSLDELMQFFNVFKGSVWHIYKPQLF